MGGVKGGSHTSPSAVSRRSTPVSSLSSAGGAPADGGGGAGGGAEGEGKALVLFCLGGPGAGKGTQCARLAAESTHFWHSDHALPTPNSMNDYGFVVGAVQTDTGKQMRHSSKGTRGGL